MSAACAAPEMLALATTAATKNERMKAPARWLHYILFDSDRNGNHHVGGGTKIGGAIILNG